MLHSTIKRIHLSEASNYKLTCRVLGRELLKLSVHRGGGSVLQQGFLCLDVILGIDHSHVDVDGVDPGYAEAHSDLVPIEDPALDLGLGHLGRVAVKEFNETPVLNDSIFHRDLKKSIQ